MKYYFGKISPCGEVWPSHTSRTPTFCFACFIDFTQSKHAIQTDILKQLSGPNSHTAECNTEIYCITFHDIL
jgi:hypothetical protein